MSPVWEKIRRRAMTCIDEVYPAAENGNAAFFPVDEFLLEAGRIIVRTVPARALGDGMPLSADQLEMNPDGSGHMPLPAGFLRLIRVRLKGWARPVTDPIDDAHPRYVQQFNPTLRGGPARPVAAVCSGGTRLELYSSRPGRKGEMAEGRYFGLTSTDDTYPERLEEVTAWKAAELVLSSMTDMQAAQICAAKVNEHLQTL